ncbi:MAG: TIGR03016 family PEP-CTERM system-associated outer membrane protein [Candidatus Accumulibacter sp.]|jgi:uncharacterized protein (PEP-CTERM system associated)|nr:TIGR03016 family PEP-CTERM system-associated outer membrane protein [Accumulibacter sp.]
MATAARSSALLLVALGAAAPPASAGDWRIVPSISVSATATNNIDQTKKNRKSERIVDVTPGINIVGQGDRLKLSLNYQLHGLFHANESRRNNHQNSLDAAMSLEAIENLFFVDVKAAISQQSLSAFASAPNSSVDTNNAENTVETRTFRISPYLRGAIGNAAEYLVRYDYSKMTTDESNSFDDQTRLFTAHVGSQKDFSRLGWAVDLIAQRNDFGQGRDTKADTLRGSLTYRVDPQLRVSATAGREAHNYASIKKKSHAIVGAGVEWAPTDRTLVAASRENRTFGNSDSFSFTHRTAGTSWKYSQSKDYVTSTDQSSGSVGTYFSLLDSMFSSAIPDPAARAAYINAMLAASGIAPGATLQGGFLTSGVTLQERKELSLALVGVRNTVTFAATHTETEDISKGTGSGWFLGTDFANLENIRQTGASVNWSHKLTGLSTLTGSASRLRSRGKGSGSNPVKMDETMYTLNFLTKLGPKTSAGLGARYVEADGTTEYTEAAVTGTFTHQF